MDGGIFTGTGKGEDMACNTAKLMKLVNQDNRTMQDDS